MKYLNLFQLQLPQAIEDVFGDGKGFGVKITYIEQDQPLGLAHVVKISQSFIGDDDFGNKYFTNSKGKRWVIYKKTTDSSKIPPEWHLWIHFLKANSPSKNISKNNTVQKLLKILGRNKLYFGVRRRGKKICSIIGL